MNILGFNLFLTFLIDFVKYIIYHINKNFPTRLDDNNLYMS
jgi:hypothetical protein